MKEKAKKMGYLFIALCCFLGTLFCLQASFWGFESHDYKSAFFILFGALILLCGCFVFYKKARSTLVKSDEKENPEDRQLMDKANIRTLVIMNNICLSGSIVFLVIGHYFDLSHRNCQIFCVNSSFSQIDFLIIYSK